MDRWPQAADLVIRTNQSCLQAPWKEDLMLGPQQAAEDFWGMERGQGSRGERQANAGWF